MGFETQIPSSIVCWFWVRNLPMGFETLKTLLFLQKYPWFETSLWDLKLCVDEIFFNPRVFETSLWDLKLVGFLAPIKLLPVRNLPMGFETGSLFPAFYGPD